MNKYQKLAVALKVALKVLFYILVALVLIGGVYSTYSGAASTFAHEHLGVTLWLTFGAGLTFAFMTAEGWSTFKTMWMREPFSLLLSLAVSVVLWPLSWLAFVID